MQALRPSDIMSRRPKIGLGPSIGPAQMTATPSVSIEKPRRGAIAPDAGVIVVLSYFVLDILFRHIVARLSLPGDLPYSGVVERAIYLSLVLPYLVLARRIRLRDIIGSFALPGREHLRFSLMMLGATIVLALVVQVIVEILFPGSHGFVTPRYLLDEIVIPPLNEEPVFRGVILSSLIGVFGEKRWPPILFSAVMFALIHEISLLKLAITLTLGILLAVTFHRTRSLSGCMLLHALWNLLT
jgi:membrane protease YdiL (CAAX protease family)